MDPEEASDEATTTALPDEIDLEVPEADRLEQAIDVELDPEDYSYG